MSSTQKRAILQVRIREEDKQHAERLYDAGSVEKVGVRALAAPVSDIRNQLIS